MGGSARPTARHAAVLTSRAQPALIHTHTAALLLRLATNPLPTMARLLRLLGTYGSTAVAG